MEEIVVLILQVVFELIINVLAYVPLDQLPSSNTEQGGKTLLARCVLWFLGGAAIALLSLLILPKSLIAIPALRVLNLAFAPILSAYLSQFMATSRGRKDDGIKPRDHFWQAFWFTFALVAVRLATVART